jgi:hypothetical protein
MFMQITIVKKEIRKEGLNKILFFIFFYKKKYKKKDNQIKSILYT